MFCFRPALAFGLLMQLMQLMQLMLLLLVLAQAGTAAGLARQVGHLERRNRIGPGMLSQ